MSCPLEANLDRRSVFQCLIDDAITLGEFEQLIELVLVRVGVDIKAQANLRKANRRILGDAERAAEIEITLSRDGGGLEWNLQRSGHSFQRHSGARDERFEQHITG